MDRKYFVGIDSDGCVFDTMELKHKECFIPNTIRYFGLRNVSRVARETAEFVNLYSRYRATNRFSALITMLDLLRDRPEVAEREVEVPTLEGLREWLASEKIPSNTTLKEALERTGNPDLRLCMKWSNAVNESIEILVQGMPAFRWVRESLQKLRPQCELVVVSATPQAALKREWRERGLDGLVDRICGQELGSKKVILADAANYPKSNRLMIGDAMNDLLAARACECLFFPVLPNRETESWERLYSEALDKFFEGTFQGEYENGLISEFERILPDLPPWRVNNAP